jgi:hypothetical protein
MRRFAVGVSAFGDVKCVAMEAGIPPDFAREVVGRYDATGMLLLRRKMTLAAGPSEEIALALRVVPVLEEGDAKKIWRRAIEMAEAASGCDCDGHRRPAIEVEVAKVVEEIDGHRQVAIEVEVAKVVEEILGWGDVPVDEIEVIGEPDAAAPAVTEVCQTDGAAPVAETA